MAVSHSTFVLGNYGNAQTDMQQLGPLYTHRVATITLGRPQEGCKRKNRDRSISTHCTETTLSSLKLLEFWVWDEEVEKSRRDQWKQRPDDNGSTRNVNLTLRGGEVCTRFVHILATRV